MVERLAQLGAPSAPLVGVSGPRRSTRESGSPSTYSMTIRTPSSSVAVSNTGDEVRVVQRCAELRLAGEALLDVDGAVGVQALDGHLAAEALVLAEEDRGHAAGPQMPDYPIAAVKK